MSIHVFENMLNSIITSIDIVDNEAMTFHSNDGKIFMFYHQQECCEYVYIEDICGDVNDLMNSPLLQAERIDNLGPELNKCSYTWTFYKFATIKGSVTVRWLGTSNGCYSESVNFEELTGV